MDAMHQTGLCFYFAHGTQQDDSQAIHWFGKAAQRNDAASITRLGLCHENGRGCDKDEEKAAQLYALAAEQGDDDAQYFLANLHFAGRGVERNPEKALELYLKAAQQGHAGAQSQAGYCYEKGMGCEKSAEKALAWYRKAQDGSTDCTDAIRRLTADRRSIRIVCVITLALSLIVAVVCCVQFFSGVTPSGIPALAGIAGTALCLRTLRRLPSLADNGKSRQ